MLLHRCELANRSRLFRNSRSNRNNSNNRIMRSNCNSRGSVRQRRRCQRGHRNYRPFQIRVRELPSLRCRLLLRSRRLLTFGHASRNQDNRQRTLRLRGPQKSLKSKSQRSKSSLNFGRLLRRVRTWTRLSIRVGRGMQVLNHLLKSLSLLATRQ